ncbi:hypothetical protein C2G38_2041044 [Gigaspora rosea]|uniref:Uncharacterized protein n=1 Tax=Gigaspora rosea TaxID=44941 RepID=A0A397UUT1_9GLOM|nr:hypothetical protein C2G38_2041044 [Gigaspora rosea]
MTQNLAVLCFEDNQTGKCKIEVRSVNNVKEAKLEINLSKQIEKVLLVLYRDFFCRSWDIFKNLGDVRVHQEKYSALKVKQKALEISNVNLLTSNKNLDVKHATLEEKHKSLEEKHVATKDNNIKLKLKLAETEDEHGTLKKKLT